MSWYLASKELGKISIGKNALAAKSAVGADASRGSVVPFG
jgi:hypothetical protein